MNRHPAAIAVALLLSVAAFSGAAAQAPLRLADRPVPRFVVWTPGGSPGVIAPATIPVAPEHRLRHGLIGGAIGAVAGFAACTVIANLVADPGSSFTTCPADTYVVMTGGGFALGFLVGWLL